MKKFDELKQYMQHVYTDATRQDYVVADFDVQLFVANQVAKEYQTNHSSELARTILYGTPPIDQKYIEVWLANPKVYNSTLCQFEFDCDKDILDFLCDNSF